MTRLQRFLIVALVAMLGLLALEANAIWALWRRQSVDTIVQRPSIGGPFTLMASDGTTVTDRTYRGKIVLVYFGYTLCPDTCPTTLNQIAEALAKLGTRADRIQALFITIDPRRDTPTILAAFVKNFDPRIVGLTGTSEQIASAAKAYGVYYAPFKTKDAPDGYLMDHTSLVYVMDREGRFVATFNPETSAEEMAARLAKLIDNPI